MFEGSGGEKGQGAFGQHGSQALVPGDQHGQPLPQRYKFSPEEIRVLRECNKESFYYRSLPLGTLLGVGAYYGVRMGYMKPSSRYGAGPKMFGFSVLGYFIGKLSYQRKCADKLMVLPNSQLAEALRKQKGKLGFQESLTMEPGFVTASPTGTPGFPDSPQEPGSFTDVGDTRPMTSFDTESSTFTGMMDHDTTQEMLNDENLPELRPKTFTTSYDELRRQNRDEYERKVQTGVPSAPRSQTRDPSAPSTTRDDSQLYSSPLSLSSDPYSRDSDTTPPLVRKKRNIYGDVWDDKTQ